MPLDRCDSRQFVFALTVSTTLYHGKVNLRLRRVGQVLLVVETERHMSFSEPGLVSANCQFDD